MSDLEDDIFQALCQIENLSTYFGDGATIQHCRDDVVTLRLSDDSESSIYLAPVLALVDTLRAMK